MIDPGTSKAVVYGMLTVMVGGPIALLVHRIKRAMGMGYRFIQVLTILEIIPAIVILAVLGILQGETCAALVGAALGYVFALKAKEE